MGLWEALNGILYQQPQGALAQPNGLMGALYENPMMRRQVEKSRAANPRPDVTDFMGYGPDWKSYLAGVAQNVQGNFPSLGDTQEQGLAKMLGLFSPGVAGATVFHGSPHKFDKFDLSKVGTGEGAQAYGHGLYFADNPSVAKGYREGLSGKYAVEGLPPIPRKASGHSSIDFKNDLEQLMGVSSVSPQSDMIPFLRQRLEDRVSRWKQSRENFGGGSAVDDMNALVNWYEGHLRPRVAELGPQTVKPGGALYRVDLPDEAIGKMLDWDAPLSKQPEAVRKALEPYMDRIILRDPVTGAPAPQYGEPFGQEIYKKLGGTQQASDLLKSLGIPGIKYLDQGSRGKGQGTSNYVVFDDQLPKIVGRE